LWIVGAEKIKKSLLMSYF
jgi:hypothetical protein